MSSSDIGSDTEADGDDDTGSGPSLGRDLAVVAVVALLGTSALVRTSAVVDVTTAVIGSILFAGIGLALVVLWRRSASESRASTQGDDAAADESDADDEGNIWNAIPPWQYDGRHVESGGLARDEQNRALQDIQDEADELAGSDDPSRKS